METKQAERPPNTSDSPQESQAWRALFCVSLINSAQASLSLIGIPHFSNAAGLAQSQLSVLLATMPVCAGIAAFIAGPVSDYLGRKRILEAGLVLLGLSLLLHIFADRFLPLLILRGFTGLATGLLMGLPATLLSDSVPIARQQSLTGRTLCGYAIGQAIGIPGGIALMNWTGYLALNSIIGIIALACIPLSIASLPSPTPAEGSLVRWFQRYARQARVTLTCPRFALVAIGSFMSFATLSGFYVTFALWLFEVANLRPTSIAPMYLGAGLLQIFVLGFLIQRLPAISAPLLVSLSLLANAALFFGSGYAYQSVVSAAVLFALTLGAVSLRIPALPFIVNNHGETQQKGLRMSLTQAANHLGKAAGAFLAGTLFPRFPAYQITLACGVLALACSAVFIALRQANLKNPSQTSPSWGGPDKNPDKSGPEPPKRWPWHTRCYLKMSRKQPAKEYQGQ